MAISETIRILLVKEKMTLTELARLATSMGGREYTVGDLSQKLRKNTLRYDEAEFLLNAMGYNISIIKKT